MKLLPLLIGLLILTGCSHAEKVQVTFDIEQRLGDPNECMIRVRDRMKLVWPETWRTQCSKFNNDDSYSCHLVFSFCQPSDNSLKVYIEKQIEDSVNEAKKAVTDAEEKLDVYRQIVPAKRLPSRP